MKKKFEELLRKIEGRAQLNYNPGRFEYDRRFKPTKKIRRHWGRKQARIQDKMPLDWIRENCLEDNSYWDDWLDFRDGFRNTFWNLNKEELEHMTKKLRKEKKIREAKKEKGLNSL